MYQQYALVDIEVRDATAKAKLKRTMTIISDRLVKTQALTVFQNHNTCSHTCHLPEVICYESLEVYVVGFLWRKELGKHSYM